MMKKILLVTEVGSGMNLDAIEARVRRAIEEAQLDYVPLVLTTGVVQLVEPPAAVTVTQMPSSIPLYPLYPSTYPEITYKTTTTEPVHATPLPNVDD